MFMDKRLHAVVIAVLLTGCAIGYSDTHKAIGVAVGNAEISSCGEAPVEDVDCPKVEGGSISITAGGVITSLVSFLTGWLM